MKTCLLLLFCLAVSATTAAAATSECKETDFGKCFNVHGRYNIYADGDTIWIVGTHRRLEAVDDNLDNILEKAGWQEHSIYGDFVVCPKSQYQPHHGQSVCIQSYKNIRVAEWK
jgi:hypothetical protein